VVVEDGLAVSFEDGFGGHWEGSEVCLLLNSCQCAVLARWLFADRNAKLVYESTLQDVGFR
jgi:hypothetical protein